MRKTRYSGGKLIVRDDLSYSAAVHELITSLQFLNVRAQAAERLPVTGRRNRVYRFYFAPANRWLVMKVTRLDQNERLWRKLDWYQRRLRKDYAEVAYRGALRLERAGIGTGRAVAFWSYGASRLHRESYFLYEHVEGTAIAQHHERIRGLPRPFRRLISTCAIEKTIQMTRRLHAHGLRHGDIHSRNMLVDFNPRGCPRNRRAILSRLRVFLIDTDHVRVAGMKVSVVKRFFDLRCLHSMDFHQYGRRPFLQAYLDQDYRIWWWWVLKFWSRGGFKLGDWFKPPRSAPRLAPFALMVDTFVHNATGALILI